MGSQADKYLVIILEHVFFHDLPGAAHTREFDVERLREDGALHDLSPPVIRASKQSLSLTKLYERHITLQRVL